MLVDVLQEMSQGIKKRENLLCRFEITDQAMLCNYCVSGSDTEKPQFEVFFCCDGALTLHRKQNADIEIGRDEIVLLSTVLDLVSVELRKELTGFGLILDEKNCKLFAQVYQMLGHASWDCKQVRDFLEQHDGYLQLKHGSWNLSVFSALHSLNEADQEFYCILKSVELFYLLNTRQALSEDISKQPDMPAYLVERLVSMGTYIENHLDEKLSISYLCKQFNMSPTTLKTKFREFYGQPIHKWVLQRRICRASELLRSTDMTILQIAQCVGYESVSQFNVVFRRTYGTAPNLYRKNVQNSNCMSNSIGNGDFSIL